METAAEKDKFSIKCLMYHKEQFAFYCQRTFAVTVEVKIVLKMTLHS